MISEVATAVLALSGVVTAGSAATVALLLYRRFSTDDPPGVWQKRVERYDRIMSSIMRINSLSIELNQNDEYMIEQEKYTMAQESEYDDLADEIIQANQQSFFIIDSEVKNSVSDYITYLSQVHEGGPELEEQMRLSGEVIKAMRKDLNLDPVYTDQKEKPPES